MRPAPTLCAVESSPTSRREARATPGISPSWTPTRSTRPSPPKSVATIPGWGKDYWNAATIEFWYKPAIPTMAPGTGSLPAKQVLLEYETGDPHDVLAEDMSGATPDVQEAAGSIPNGVGNGQ